MPTKKPKPIVEYRNYYLPSSFPVLLLTGDNWKISDVRSEHLHFHNCLEGAEKIKYRHGIDYGAKASVFRRADTWAGRACETGYVAGD